MSLTYHSLLLTAICLLLTSLPEVCHGYPGNRFFDKFSNATDKFLEKLEDVGDKFIDELGDARDKVKTEIMDAVKRIQWNFMEINKSELLIIPLQ